MGTLKFNVPVTDKTNISDVKSHLHERFTQQCVTLGKLTSPLLIHIGENYADKNLYRVTPMTYILGFIESEGPEFSDSSEITKIMSKFNTQKFFLSLHEKIIHIDEFNKNDKANYDSDDNSNSDDDEEIIVG
jgi:hypothetical protein